MQTKQKATFNVGGGFTSLLAVLFIGLKLTNYIDWSWWWVLSPIWIPIALLLVVALFVVVLMATIFKS